MSYTRVLPRDLFNEAKLLKCLGQLSLVLHDGVGVDPDWRLILTHDDGDGPGFNIRQRNDDGGLWCKNLYLMTGPHFITLYTAYNSKEPFPLYFELQNFDGAVFTDGGKFTSDFIEALDAFKGGQCEQS